MNSQSSINPKAKIGKNTVIEAFSYIDDNVIIGSNCWIGNNVTIYSGARIGNNVKIFPGAVISSVPQDLKFDGELRPRQNEIINKYTKYIKKVSTSGLLDLYTGAGKTVIALKIITLIQLKTLIIVHKGFLLDQWIERINQINNSR